MKKKPQAVKTIQNRRAKFDYELGDSLVVGLELTGAEVKSLRMGHGHLKGAYVTSKDGQLWLFNATITGTKTAPIADQDQTRSRRILAKRKEIDELLELKKQGRSIVALELLTKGRYIKLRIAEGRGKRKYDKREVLKRRDADRQAAIQLKHR